MGPIHFECQNSFGATTDGNHIDVLVVIQSASCATIRTCHPGKDKHLHDFACMCVLCFFLILKKIHIARLIKCQE
jgi:hypothetical protein